MRKTLFMNGRILTQCHGLTADSMAVNRHQIEAVGIGLQHDPQFKSFFKFDLKGKTIIPGLVDAHTHLYFWAQSLGRVTLQGCDSIESCLKRIKKYADQLPLNGWVIGEGYSPDAFRKRTSPDRYMLDRVTGGRPAFMFSKDEHTAWVNSAALNFAGITKDTSDPIGGRIERDLSGEPSGLLREGPAFQLVYRLIPQSGEREMRRLWQQAVALVRQRGVTGVHSVDSPEGFSFMEKLAEHRKLGLRINYYPRIEYIADLEKARIRYGQGDNFLRIAGIKIFVDGSLGSQTALCFHRYTGSKTNYGVEVTSKELLAKQVRRAARLGFPCAIHAIGDRAVSNVLDVLQSAPKLPPGRRHRIEHVQLIRRTDIARFKKLGVVASMQPSHCASDVTMIRRYWPDQARNAYLFKSICDTGVTMAFGSDCPIEPLDPLAGMAAAVRRVPKGSRQRFFPSESLDAARALFAFTAGPAFAAGEENSRGYLLPGYPVDFVILPEDPTQIPPDRLYDLPVLATVLDGEPVFADSSLHL
jgi:hypothetical protein